MANKRSSISISNRGLRHSPILWKPWRAVLRAILARAARKGLKGAALDNQRPELGTWDGVMVSRLMLDMEATADALRPAASLTQFRRVGSRMMVEPTVYTVAAYRTLLDRGVSRDAVARTVHDLGWAVCKDMLGLYSLPARLLFRDPARRIRTTLKLLRTFPFNAPGRPDYEVTTWADQQRIFTHFTHCPPQSAVRAIMETHSDRGDLDAFFQGWCQYDWPGADIIAGDGASGHYARPHTLSRDDSVCDMCWIAK